MNVLDLFSGIGGFSLGLERAGPFRTVAFCEREPFPQAVLRKHWPEVPIYDDVRTIPTERLGRIDLICGGFPCQPWSVAGQQRGAEDDRDLWPAMAALVKKLRPTWVIGENVRGFVNQPMGLQRSLSDLESLGYEAVPFIIPACSVDAPHRRDRVWIIAARDDAYGDGVRPHRTEVDEQREGEPADGQERHVRQVCEILAGSRDAGKRDTRDVPNSDNAIGRRGKERRQGWHGQSELHGAERLAAHADSKVEPDGAFDARQGCGELGAVADADSERRYGGAEEHGSHGREFVAGNGEAVADADDAGCEQQWRPQSEPAQHEAVERGSRWLAEPGVGRVAHGVPRRVDRLKALGNAVVPQVVEQIGRAILEVENAP